jgi:hypothetical protein
MVSRTAALLLVVAGLCASPAWGTRVFGQQPAPPGPRQPARPPAIDPLTASITGRITSDSGAPIRRAEVRAMSSSGINRLATTDGEGRFDLRDMPAGQYRVTVSKSGFTPLMYGQRRPFESPRPIDLKQGQRVTANMVLPRGGAITGRVYDEAGEAIADVRVQALRSRMTEGKRRLEPVGPGDVTDDTGTFRIYGLPPGDYYVTASPPRRQETLPIGAPLERNVPATDVRSAMTTFYPGTASLEDAQRVTIGAGAEARADIQIGPVRAAVVSGIVLSASGAPSPTATLTLRSDAFAGVTALMAGRAPLMMIIGQITGHTNPDGTFVLPGVPPGAYTLDVTVQHVPDPFQVVRTTAGATGRIDPNTGTVRLMDIPAPETASIPVVVTGADITGLTITAGSGGSIEGTFVADRGVTQPLPPRTEVNVRLGSGGASSMRMSGGTVFKLMGLNGLVHLAAEGLPEGWAVKAILADGADVTDEPLDFRNGRNLNMRIVLTDRVTVVTGSVLQDASRGTGPDERANHNVVVFPEDAKKRTYPSRYVRAVRTDDQGTFRISGLPGDERYVAVAVDYVEDGEWTDPEFLERVSARGTSFSLGEAERQAIELRLVTR